ncbi:MAG TPA: peptidoglycan-binding protein [Candidatus Paceibacterota bacterium]
MRTFFTSSSALVLAFALLASAFPAAAASANRTAFEETVTTDDLAQAYAEARAGGKPLRILIVPGHEPAQGGTMFAGYYERELVVDIAARLKEELGSDTAFEVLVARGTQGWNDDLARYFAREEDDIEEFVEDHKRDMRRLERRGRIADPENQAPHNEAASDVALRLYGITKWANEHEVDLMVHLHLNDETGHPEDERGAHSGVAIYVPDEIYGNAAASRAIAEPVFARLQATNATSTFGFEQEGVLEDRDLIAIGANNTSEVPSLLIEYGYIYEERITDGAREALFADFAYQTALGIKDFFGSPGRPQFATKALPRAFTADLLATTTASSTPEDIYALQAALTTLGFYPGTEASLNVCPVSGILNECTTEAVKAFQKAKGFEQTGTLGPLTRGALNASLGIAAAPAPAAPIAYCALPETLAPEATGEGVENLQRLLAQDPAVYPEGLVTGYYGPATDRAVKRFQEKHKIVAAGAPGYGLVGPMTRATLSASCSTVAS